MNEKMSVSSFLLHPSSFRDTETNLANLQAAERQHAKTIHAKIARRDEKLNEQLIPLFDPSGRVFFGSDDPRPVETAAAMSQEKQDLLLGVRTINEVRTDRGLPPVEWGDRPFSPEKVTGEALNAGSAKGQ
jgi:hypothetical protein